MKIKKLLYFIKAFLLVASAMITVTFTILTVTSLLFLFEADSFWLCLSISILLGAVSALGWWFIDTHANRIDQALRLEAELLFSKS